MKTPLYYFILITRLLPAAIFIIPLYILFARLNLLNTFLGIIIAYTAMALPLVVWLFRGFIATIPFEIEEAAMIDGCSRLQALFKITLPLLAPGIGAVSMYVFLFAWNQFLLPLVLANNLDIISVRLLYFMCDYFVDWGGLLATTILMIILALIFGVVMRVFKKRLFIVTLIF